MAKEFLYKELSYKIVGIALRVHSKLGSFLPEHCYHRALVKEFIYADIPCTSQQKHGVYYSGEQVGHFFTDIIVDNKIILELKSQEAITGNHLSQLFTYLRVCQLRVGYLFNFGARHFQLKRLIL
jgi:GxxExxY protein